MNGLWKESILGGILALFTVVLLSWILSTGNSQAEETQQPNTVKLETYNPYNLDVALEVKCDHRLNRWTYHKKFTVKGKSRFSLLVPNNLRNCQIWPKIIWW